MVSTERVDLAAFEDATRLSPAALVTALRAALGARLVAVIAGVKETRAVHQWADGARDVRDPQVLDRLRLTYRVVWPATPTLHPRRRPQHGGVSTDRVRRGVRAV
jgi:hypothetical protein